MSYLIRNIQVVDTTSIFHNQKIDILVENGQIIKVGQLVNESAENVIKGEGKFLSKGWVDTFADFGCPGFEHRETVDSGAKAAKSGGFGHVFVAPNNKPVTDTASEITYLNHLFQKENIILYPIGAATQKCEGNELSEMMDMASSGAIAFSDGWKPIQNDLVIFKAFEFLKGIDKTLIQIPIHEKLDAGALINESERSVAFGLMGTPDVAEEIKIYKDIALCKYTKGKLHISGVSTQKGMDLIIQAKQEGVNVTCSVTPYHLLFTDEELGQYNSLYKVYPVLRSKKDVQALRQALIDGFVDCISSHHRPHDWDEKVKELDYAMPGMAALEVTWPMLLKSGIELSVEKWIQILVDAPRKIFSIKDEPIDVGYQLPLTIFDFDQEWVINANCKQSKAFNVPCLNQTLIGKAIVL